MKPLRNETAPAANRGDSQNSKCSQNKTRSGSGSNNKDYETRRMAAACFRNPRKRQDFHPDFTGVIVTDDLLAGTKCWVNIRERVSRRTGQRYLSIELRRQEVTK
jgi:hypothetical protein